MKNPPAVRVDAMSSGSGSLNGRDPGVRNLHCGPDAPTGVALSSPGCSQPVEAKVFNLDSSALRVILDEGGQPWFVAADVCAALGVRNVSMALARLHEADVSSTEVVDSAGRRQSTKVVNESGLYALIMGSRKAEAKRFQRWVTGEVLPAIRKTGRYEGPAPGAHPSTAPVGFVLGELIAYVEKSAREKSELEARVAGLEHESRALNRLTESVGSMCIRDAAAHRAVSERRLIERLDKGRWVYRCAGGDRRLRVHADARARGLVEPKFHTFTGRDGRERESEQVLVTGRGLARLAVLVETWGLRTDQRPPQTR